MKNKYDARLFMFRTAVFEALIDGAFGGIAEEFPEFCDYKIHVGGLLVGLPFGLRELSQSEAMRIASLVIPERAK